MCWEFVPSLRLQKFPPLSFFDMRYYPHFRSSEMDAVASDSSGLAAHTRYWLGNYCTSALAVDNYLSLARWVPDIFLHIVGYPGKRSYYASGYCLACWHQNSGDIADFGIDPSIQSDSDVVLGNSGLRHFCHCIPSTALGNELAEPLPFAAIVLALVST